MEHSLDSVFLWFKYIKDRLVVLKEEPRKTEDISRRVQLSSQEENNYYVHN
jgi:hypothetical protein